MPQRPVAASRNSDPYSSHLAAHEMEKKGNAQAQRQLCLKAVRESPGKTAAEIAVIVGLDRHAPSRRLPELKTAGLVEKGKATQCSVVGSSCLTWWPAPATATDPTAPTKW